MATPQPGIFANTLRSQYALEYTVTGNPDGIIGTLRRTLKDINHVIAFGANYYVKRMDVRAPENLRPLTAITGVSDKSVPATGGDLFVWIQENSPDLAFDAAQEADQILTSSFQRTLELPGFIYRDSRDLTGFIDGSANPKGNDRMKEALVPEGQVGAGGAHVFTQKWIHNLCAFNQLSQTEQEKVIGRTKPDSIEFKGDDMPRNAHVSRTDVKIDGIAQKIWRRSFPYGILAEHGLYFLAFSCDPSRIFVILKRMFGVSGDGLWDRLTDFSTPVTGALWFAPSLEDLENL